jgi:hypothetical protein
MITYWAVFYVSTVSFIVIALAQFIRYAKRAAK